MYPMQGDASISSIRSITVTITAGNSSGNTVHNMGKTPTILGRPNPNKLDGLNSRASADGTNITVDCNEIVATNTDFTVGVI